MFSLAIAVYDDYDSLVCSTMANVLHNMEHINEVVVCDNNPTSPQGLATKDFCLVAGWKYVPFDTITGTAATKNRAITECKAGNWVVYTDSHVILLPFFFEEFNKLKLRPGLYHGPLYHDNGDIVSTHLSEVWSDGMKGQWVSESRVRTLSREAMYPVTNAATGMFIVHRDHWLGYNPRFKGFGGEESYLQTKYIQAGYPVACITSCQWWHRFGRPHGVKYPLSNLDKFRNYLIGWEELELDKVEVINHFVSSGFVTKDQARELLGNGLEFPIAPVCGSCTRRVHGATIDDAMIIAATGEFDIAEHVVKIAELAKNCSIVFDIGSRASSSLAIADNAEQVIHLGTLVDKDVEQVNRMGSGIVIDGRVVKADSLPAPDMVFIDTDPHDYANVSNQLATYGVKSTRYIVLHDTTTFTEVMRAVVDFVKANRKFTVVYKVENNNGLVVLSCDEQDKQKVPSLGRRALTFARALTSFIGSGGAKATEEEYQSRLAICDICPFRNDDRCGQCGCPVDKKVAWKTETCPVGKW